MNWFSFFNRLWCVFAIFWTVFWVLAAERFLEGLFVALIVVIPSGLLLLGIGWAIDGLKKPYE